MDVPSEPDESPGCCIMEAKCSAPRDGMSPTDIAWANMKTADELLNLQLFIFASLGWFSANPGKNYQQLEDELRRRDFNTHLIARTPRMTGASLNIPFTKSPEMDWECIASCRPVKAAVEEMLQHAVSYEENWAKLAFAGIYGIYEDDESCQQILEGAPLETISGGPYLEQVMKNKTVIVGNKMSVEEYFAKIKQRYANVKLEPICVHLDASAPVIAFVATIDGKRAVVSEIGFLYQETESGPGLVVVNLPRAEARCEPVPY